MSQTYQPLPCPITGVLLDLLLADSRDADRFAGYEDHIQGCLSCRLALDTIHRFIHAGDALPDAMHEDHATVGEIPDEERLIAYAELTIMRGVNAATQRFPSTATHLAACVRCQNRLAAIRDLLPLGGELP